MKRSEPAPPDPASRPAGVPTRPPRAGGRTRALLLAIAMHVLLFALLFVGIRWQNTERGPVQAELWVPPPPAPEPPRPEPKPPPEPRPEPAPPPPKPQPAPEPRPDLDAQIKAEQEKKRKEEADRKEREAEKKAAEKKLAEERRQREEQARREAEKKAAEKLVADKAAAEKVAAEKKASEEKARREAAARHEETIKALMKQAGSAGQPADTAAKASAGGSRADAGFSARVGAAVKANTTYQVPADLEGNPKAVFAVQLRPDCSLVSVRLRRSSGVAAWDQAAERGIQRTDPFPRPAEGACPADLEITRGPRDER